MSNPKIRMKLFIDSSKNKVVFAEAGKECVDFFLHILSFPLGSVVMNLANTSKIGSLGNLYGSFRSLGANYLQEGLNKDCLLKPSPPAGVPSLQVPLFAPKPIPIPVVVPASKRFYTCRNLKSDCRNYQCHSYVSDGGGEICPYCHTLMNLELTYKKTPSQVQTKAPAADPTGYVKGVVSYMIMDDLCIEPMSTSALLNRSKVEDVGCLEEREVTIDMNEGLALLKASIKSETVLTHVFLLGNKAAAASS